MNPDRDKTSSWKLIREIQRRQIAAKNPSVSDSGYDRKDMEWCEKSDPRPLSITWSNMKRNAAQNAIVSKLALMGIVLAVFMLPFAETKAIVASILVTVVALSGFIYMRITAALDVDAGAKPIYANSLSQENESLRDQNWELREREERFRSLSDAFGDLLMDRNANGEITYINTAFIDLLQTTEPEIVGKKFPFEIEKQISDDRTGAASTVNTVRINVSGNERWLSWIDLPIRSEFTTENIVRTVARDVTAQYQTEQKLRTAKQNAQSASNAKTQFLANVSHEMRTPLNGILGMSGLLADTSLTREQETYVSAVHDSGISLLTLIEDILDMTLVEAGRLEIKATAMDPQKLVEDVCELLSSRAHLKSISIGSYVSAQVPKEIRSDPGRLRQVLINLIGNAIKFTETGGVYISCTTEQEDNHPPSLIFEVHDTGPGIAAADQQKIFEEFSQANNESTREHGGAGLGLAISKRIVEKMGGKIGLGSEIGVGSCFYFSFPLSERNEEVPDEAASQNLNKSHYLVSKDEITAQVLENYASEVGCDFQLQGDAGHLPIQQAWGSKDILIVDADTIGDDKSKFDTLLQGVPSHVLKIILLTPEERKSLDEYLDVGMDGYLIKPVRKSTYLSLVSGGQVQDPRECESTEIAKWKTGVRQSRPKSILLAEDNEINALLARALIEKAGHTVTRAVNGQEAFHLLEEREQGEPFDMVLLDLQMPVMDGIEALTLIRAKESENSTEPLPVYILTADEHESSRSSALKSGATGFLTKPLDPEKFLNILDA